MKSVSLTLRLNSTEPTTDNDTAVEMALDRLPAGFVAALSDAGFKIALPIDSDVLDCEFRPELGDERFELDGEERLTFTPTHIHRVTGEPVIVTGHVNGITIFDSPEEEGEELLDVVFDEQYQQYLVYVPTHRSRSDGSDAMLIGQSENGLNLLLQNEDGYQWQDSINEWEQIG